MTRLAALTATIALLAACTPEMAVVDDDRADAFPPMEYGPAVDEFRGTLEITDHGDGTWSGTETSTWFGVDGTELCGVVWVTSGVVDQNVGGCDDCDITWDVICSEATVVTEPGSCEYFVSDAYLSTPQDFWIGFQETETGAGSYWTGNDDPVGNVGWGVAGTASFDGLTLTHDDTFDW